MTQQRGRKSEASLEIAELAPIIGRPPAPAELTPEQAAIWSRIIECESPGFIKSTQFGMLKNYCRLEALGEALVPTDAATTKQFIQISHEMSSIARALRLTNQSRYHTQTAARKEGSPRPWGFHKA